MFPAGKYLVGNDEVREPKLVSMNLSMNSSWEQQQDSYLDLLMIFV